MQINKDSSVDVTEIIDVTVHIDVENDMVSDYDSNQMDLLPLRSEITSQLKDCWSDKDIVAKILDTRECLVELSVYLITYSVGSSSSSLMLIVYRIADKLAEQAVVTERLLFSEIVKSTEVYEVLSSGVIANNLSSRIPLPFSYRSESKITHSSV